MTFSWYAAHSVTHLSFLAFHRLTRFATARTD
jgi:hypothetical protein